MVIIIYLVWPWSTFHRKPMLEALARQVLGEAIIICVNPPISLRGAINRFCKFSIHGLFPFGGPKRLAENLYVGTPVILLPGAGRRWEERSIGRAIVARQLRQALSKLSCGSSKVIAWIYRPEQHSLLNIVDEEYVVYECYDEYQRDLDGSEKGSEYAQLENELLRRVDLVFATAQSLTDTRKSIRSDIYLAPNGVDFQLFYKSTDNSTSIPPEISAIPEPRLVCVGYISPCIDFELIKQIASNRHWSVIFIGSVLNDAKHMAVGLSRFSNIYFLGYTNRNLLPAYLKGADVAIIPFKDNEFNYNRNPLKLWEYMAAGKSVVSSRMAVTKNLNGIIYEAQNREEFINHLHTALHNNNLSRINKGIEIARQHSWDNLTRKMFETVKKYFDEQRF